MGKTYWQSQGIDVKVRLAAPRQLQNKLCDVVDLHYLAEACPALTHLEGTSMRGLFTHDASTAFARHCQQLKSIAIPGSFLKSKDLNELARGCSLLEQINIMGPGVSHDSIVHLLQLCPRLRKIRLMRGAINNITLQELARAQHLETVELLDFDNVTEWGILQLLDHRPAGLPPLKVSALGCNGVPNHIQKRLVSRTAEMRKEQLHGPAENAIRGVWETVHRQLNKYSDSHCILPLLLDALVRHSGFFLHSDQIPGVKPALRQILEEIRNTLQVSPKKVILTPADMLLVAELCGFMQGFGSSTPNAILNKALAVDLLDGTLTLSDMFLLAMSVCSELLRDPRLASRWQAGLESYLNHTGSAVTKDHICTTAQKCMGTMQFWIEMQVQGAEGIGASFIQMLSQELQAFADLWTPARQDFFMGRVKSCVALIMNTADEAGYDETDRLRFFYTVTIAALLEMAPTALESLHQDLQS